MSQPKIYKNPARNINTPTSKYVPQYQLMGVDPEVHSGSAPHAVVVQPEPLPLDNPRVKKAPMRMNYAESVPSPIGRGRGPVPNVGNNMEHTWSSVDGELIDDISINDLDPNQEMIDNNDFVDIESLRLSAEVKIKGTENKPFLTQVDLQKAISTNQANEEILDLLVNLDNADYLLFLKGTAFVSGSLDFVQEEASKLIFGEHPEVVGEVVSPDDIIIIKKIKLKVGVFLE
jgi:hypothetical protein